jgi:predicted nucleic acid-binding protein
MKYLFDTNVVSELQKINCNPRVEAFVDGIQAETWFLSAITIGEIAFGTEKLPPGKKRTELIHFLEAQLPDWFGERILPVDSEVMKEWARMCRQADRTLSILDSLIAATALAHKLTVLTRNTRDFEGIKGLSLINPWI